MKRRESNMLEDKDVGFLFEMIAFFDEEKGKELLKQEKFRSILEMFHRLSHEDMREFWQWFHERVEYCCLGGPYNKKWREKIKRQRPIDFINHILEAVLDDGIKFTPTPDINEEVRDAVRKIRNVIHFIKDTPFDYHVLRLVEERERDKILFAYSTPPKTMDDYPEDFVFPEEIWDDIRYPGQLPKKICENKNLLMSNILQAYLDRIDLVKQINIDTRKIRPRKDTQKTIASLVAEQVYHFMMNYFNAPYHGKVTKIVNCALKEGDLAEETVRNVHRKLYK